MFFFVLALFENSYHFYHVAHRSRGCVCVGVEVEIENIYKYETNWGVLFVWCCVFMMAGGRI